VVALAGQTVPCEAANATITARVAQVLAAPLTADAAVTVALLNNQGLRATLAGLGVFPDDMDAADLVSGSVAAGDPADRARAFVAAATAALRARALGRALDGTRRFVVRAVVDVIADCRVAFVELQAAEQQAALARTAEELADVAADLSRRTQRAGNVDRLAVDTADAAAAQARIDRVTADTAVAGARERVNTVLGLWGTSEWRIDNRFPDLPSSEVALPVLESRALEQNLELVAARQEIAAIVQGRGLRDRLRWAPAEPFAAAPPTPGTPPPNSALLLPFLDGDASSPSPERLVFLQKQQRYCALAIEALGALRGTYARLTGARDRVQLVRDALLPARARAVDQAQRLTNAMAMDPAELFRVRRAQVDAQAEYVAAEREYWLARTELARQASCCADLTSSAPDASAPAASAPAGP
jgi:cobalt-zinc-cadmium efflux system outer membrane protein